MSAAHRILGHDAVPVHAPARGEGLGVDGMTGARGKRAYCMREGKGQEEPEL